MHITKLQQTIATSQHMWLLTSKLIKKTANMTTHTAVKYQICQLMSATETRYFSFVNSMVIFDVRIAVSRDLAIRVIRNHIFGTGDPDSDFFLNLI